VTKSESRAKVSKDNLAISIDLHKGTHERSTSSQQSFQHNYVGLGLWPEIDYFKQQEIKREYKKNPLL